MEIEDTYCEVFDGLVVRVCVTARDEKRLKQAAYNATALPCTVFGESEGGIEKWLSERETPDSRKGALIQIWVNCGKGAPKKLEYEISKRIRQGILVVPTTSVFNALDSPDGKIDVVDSIGHCGDGYETIEHRFGREVIVVPIMMGEFVIERHLGYKKGIMGGNVWFFCKSLDIALEASEKALAAIESVEGVIAPFGTCSAGSKLETKYPEIGPTTNHPFCPTLKHKLPSSKVPDGVQCIPEIVINGVSLEAVKKAMRAAIESVRNIEGLLKISIPNYQTTLSECLREIEEKKLTKISAGNYGGKLGQYKIYLNGI